MYENFPLNDCKSLSKRAFYNIRCSPSAFPSFSRSRFALWYLRVTLNNVTRTVCNNRLAQKRFSGLQIYVCSPGAVKSEIQLPFVLYGRTFCILNYQSRNRREVKTDLSLINVYISICMYTCVCTSHKFWLRVTYGHRRYVYYNTIFYLFIFQ